LEIFIISLEYSYFLYFYIEETEVVDPDDAIPTSNLTSGSRGS
jgi:hypothetical protein